MDKNQLEVKFDALKEEHRTLFKNRQRGFSRIPRTVGYRLVRMLLESDLINRVQAIVIRTYNEEHDTLKEYVLGRDHLDQLYPFLSSLLDKPLGVFDKILNGHVWLDEYDFVEYDVSIGYWLYKSFSGMPTDQYILED